MNDVIAFIVEGLESEYGDPNNEGVPWESAEGGWQLPVWDTYDLFADELGDFPSSRQAVKDDLLWSFGDRQWCERNPFSLSRGEVLNYGWDDFCEEVKHKSRFVFFTPRGPIKTPAEPEEVEIAGVDFEETISPSEVLYVIGELVSELGLTGRSSLATGRGGKGIVHRVFHALPLFLRSRTSTPEAARCPTFPAFSGANAAAPPRSRSRANPCAANALPPCAGSTTRCVRPRARRSTPTTGGRQRARHARRRRRVTVVSLVVF